jgi:hypothetical protein
MLPYQKSLTKIAGSGSGFVSQSLRGAGLRIRIRTKMSRIRNTAKADSFLLF